METENIELKTEIQKAKERALRLLARRDHSALELRNKLRQKIKISEAAWVEVLESLKSLGYMAKEEDLTMRWVKQWRSEGRGRHWIGGKLRTKGLPPTNLQDDEDEIEAAKVFMSKRMRTSELSQLKLNEKARLSRSMISRGFSSSVVASLIRGR